MDSAGPREIQANELRAYIAQRAVKSLLYDSVRERLLFRIPIGYTLTHNLPTNQTEHLLSISDDATNVEIRRCLRIGELPVSLASIDPRAYIYADDYISGPITIQTSYTRNEDALRVYLRFEDFMANLGDRAQDLRLLVKGVFRVSSPFVLG